MARARSPANLVDHRHRLLAHTHSRQSVDSFAGSSSPALFKSSTQMRAGRPPEALTSYLACIDQPAFLVNRTYTREIRHWQDGRIVWQNEATAEGTELEPQDLDTVNKLLDGLGQKQDTVRSTRLERWEATWAASDSELAVLRKLPLPASPLIFEPPLQSPALSRNNSASSSKPQNLSNIAKAAGPSALALSPVSSPAAMLSKLAETDEAARVIFHHRWEDTTLGPMSQWDPCIASAVYSLLTYPWPCCLCIGPSHLMLYNTHYIRILGALCCAVQFVGMKGDNPQNPGNLFKRSGLILDPP